MGDGAIDWIANEGVRIERILAFLNAANLPDPFRIFRDELHAKRPQSMRTEDSELTNANHGQENSEPANLASGQPDFKNRSESPDRQIRAFSIR